LERSFGGWTAQPLREKRVDRTADHLSNQLVIRDFTYLARAYVLSIPEYYVRIGDFADLLEEVTYVNDAYTILTQPANQGEEAAHVRALQAAGRLVHQQDSGVGCNGAADFYDLAEGDWQASDAGPGLDLGMVEIAEQAECPISASFKIQEAQPPRFYAHYDILGNSQMGKQGELLVDERDPMVSG